MNITYIDSLSAVLAGICSISFIYFALYIISFALKDKRLRPLFYACIFSSAWSFSYVNYYLSTDAHAREFWQGILYAGMLTIVFLLWFLIRYTGLIKNKKTEVFLSLAIWIPALLHAYKSLAENAVARDFPFGFWFLYMEIQSTIYNIAGIVCLLISYKRNKTNKRYRQTFILILSAIILLTLSWIADYFLGFQHGQNLLPLWFLLWIGILLFTIKKYRFITISPDFISRDITENIEEGIILFATDLKIIFTNRAARRLFNAEADKPVQFQDLVLEKQSLDNEFLKLTEAGGDSFRTRVNLIPGGTGQKIPVDLKVKKVIDNYNDISGFLMIISRAKNIEHLKALYKITGRELEVIFQLALGKTNKDIADFLRIMPKTIETHIANIYSKLLVNNRVELLNILSEFDPVSGTSKPSVLTS